MKQTISTHKFLLSFQFSLIRLELAISNLINYGSVREWSLLSSLLAVSTTMCLLSDSRFGRNGGNDYCTMSLVQVELALIFWMDVSVLYLWGYGCRYCSRYFNFNQSN